MLAFALGGVRDVVYGLSSEDEVIDGDEPDLDDTTMTFTRLGIFADAHLSEEPGPHVQAFVGLASIGVLDDRDPGVEEPAGTAYALGVGYDVRVGRRLALGALLRMSYATLDVSEVNGTDVSVLLPALAFSATLL
jgi:hypothetical protein